MTVHTSSYLSITNYVHPKVREIVVKLLNDDLNSKNTTQMHVAPVFFVNNKNLSIMVGCITQGGPNMVNSLLVKALQIVAMTH